MNKWNGCCPESGYDKFEQEIREEFIEYAPRAGLNPKINKEYPWGFECSITNKVWRAYHVAHVRGRVFDCGEEE